MRTLAANFETLILKRQMVGRLRSAVLLFALIFWAFGAKSEHSTEASADRDIKTEIKEHIDHHLKDVHDYHLFTDETTNSHYGFPLPVILWHNGLHVFMSSAFHHGEEVVSKGDVNFAMDHGKIYVTDAAGTITYDEEHHATNVKPLDFSITKNVFNIIVVCLLMLWLFISVGRSYSKGLVPSGAAKFIEPFVVFIRDDIARPNIGEKHYHRYMSFLLTVYFFIWIVNLFGLTPLGVNVTNSTAVTFSLAIMTFIITQVSGKKEYWMHIFWMPGVPVPMKILLAPIELLGIFIKPFALMIRLYANITAGHIVMMSLIGLIFIFKSWIGSPLSFGLAFAISLLELLVAALQAYIFTMLSALYFGSAVAEHADH